MLLKLYCSSEHIPDEDWQTRRATRRRDTLQRCNVGFSVVMYLLWLLDRKGIPTEIVDVNNIPEEERGRAYSEIIPLAVSKKFRIRRVFGTKHESGSRFGKEVPALLIYDGEPKYLVDVYPRIEEQDRVVTIADYFMGVDYRRLLDE